MKICCFGDTHWSEYSSILRSMGEKYSTRLENLIKSVNWVFDIALENKQKWNRLKNFLMLLLKRNAI